MRNVNAFTSTSANIWVNDFTYTSAASFTVSPTPSKPKPKTAVDLLLADVREVCALGRAA